MAAARPSANPGRKWLLRVTSSLLDVMLPELRFNAGTRTLQRL
jgi:hypothetical protein